MFTEPPKNYSDAVDKLIIEVIHDIVDSIVEENNLINNFLTHTDQSVWHIQTGLFDTNRLVCLTHTDRSVCNQKTQDNHMQLARPNRWSRKPVLLVSWLSMVCKYLTEFSPCRDYLCVVLAEPGSGVNPQAGTILKCQTLFWGKFFIFHSLTLQPKLCTPGRWKFCQILANHR